MTTDERQTQDPRHQPTNVVTFRQPTERRSKPRWMERMDAQGLPVQDSTWRTTKDAA